VRGLSGDHSAVRLLALWYFCIGLAFIALAVRAWVAGTPGVWLRLVVALGFVLLAIAERKRLRRR